MEKIKPVLDFLKAQKFWLFCGVTLIACAVVYYLVNSSLVKEEAASTSKIKSTINSARNLQTAGVEVNPNAEEGQASGQKVHPNEATLKAMEDVVRQQAAITRDAWMKKYQRQAPYQVFDNETLELPDFDFQQYLPAEKVAFTDSEDEEGMMPEGVRINYRDFIRRELPKLASIIRSVWKPGLDKNAPRPHEVIIWNEDNQEYWNSRFTNFVSEWNVQAAESNVPRTLQVLYTTEDLWLLRSILHDVIGKTVFDKGDVYANDLAVIKQIDHIFLGKDAETPDEGLPGQGSGMGMGSSSMMSSDMMPSSSGKGRSGGKRGGKADTSLDPINGRYVDNTGKDIPSKDYRAIYKKGGTDKKKTHWKIAKRVKVRIGLLMDTREIENLLINCANATFPIEVKSVRINKHKASKRSGAGGGGVRSGGGSFGSSQGMGQDAEDRAGSLQGAGGSSAAGGSMMPGGGSGGMSGSSGMYGGGGKQTVSQDDEGYTKPVEIYGYIYIYNKVDDAMFKILNDKSTTP